jgi:hypothetical protein
MSATQHTPGPWHYVRSNGSPTTGQHMIAGAKPGYLGEVRDCGSGDVVANAHLIASAPRMLAALKQLMEWGNTTGVRGGQCFQDVARAAYEEATRA